MSHMGVELTNTYDLRLVILSIAIAVLASYTALDTAGQVIEAPGRNRLVWLLSSAVAMGAGIWSMHFIGMLAFCLPIPINYDGFTVVFSMLAAIVASGGALFLVSRPVISLPWLCSGSAVIGLGIATTHYTGMAAMRIQAIAQYDLRLVVLSVLITIALSLVALWLTFKLGNATTGASLWQKLGGAVLMGAAAASMHYTAMASARFISTDVGATGLLPDLDMSWLAFAVSMATLVILGLASLTSGCQRQALKSQVMEESARRFRSVLQNMQVGVMVIGTQFEILTLNRAALDLLGLTEGELLGKNFFDSEWDIIDEAGKSFSLESYPAARAIATHQPVRNVTMGFVHPVTEEQLWLLVNAEPLLAQDGSVEQVVCSFVDLSARKRAEAALQEQLHFLQVFIDAIPTPVVYKDAKGIYTWCNQAHEAYFGVRKEQLIGKSTDELWPTHLVDFHQKVEVESFRHGGVQVYESCVVDANGTTHDVLINKATLLKTDGSLGGVVAVLLDITERKRAEAALREAYEELENRVSQRTLELAITNTALQAEIGDRKQAELALRESEARYRELAQRETLLNHLANQIRDSLDLDTILEIAVQEIRSLMQVDWCLFFWHHTEKGTDYWDVIKEAKNPACKSLLGCYPVDKNNEVVKKLLNLELLRIDDLAQSTDKAEQQFREKGYTAILSLPLQTRSGRLGVVSCGHFSGPRCWSDSEVELLQAVNAQLEIAISQAELYDKAAHTAAKAVAQANQLSKTLQELQQTQTQLIQTEKMSSLGQMVAGIAHEINNPVNFIYGNLIHAGEYTQDLLSLLHLYQRHYPNPCREIQDLSEGIDMDFLLADLPKMLASMEMGADRIRQIVLSLRNFSRLDQAQMKPVDIHEGIDSTLMILHHRLKAQPDHCAVEVIKEYGNLPKVECYPGQLNQVFMNILANAIDALEDASAKVGVEGGEQESRGTEENSSSVPVSPTITIRTELLEDSECVVIRIRDSGLGIPAHVRNRLFDPFFTTKPVGKGTGLGLSISYQIVVERHGGVLKCFSELGQGAEFWIEIPIKQSCSNSRFSSQAINNRRLIA